MRIVTRHRSIIHGDYVFEDGLIKDLRRSSIKMKDGIERFEFNGSNSIVDLPSMRVVDDKTNTRVETIDAELEELHKRAWSLRQERRELLAKGYPKFKKVYKWDLEDVR